MGIATGLIPQSQSSTQQISGDIPRRLSKEIYEPGDSRDVTVSIEAFLGRPQSINPLLKQLGIGKE